jgi:hypothetical protein
LGCSAGEVVSSSANAAYLSWFWLSMLYLSEMEEIADADPGGGACPEVGVAVRGCNPAPIPPPPPPKGCKGAEEKKKEWK